MSRSSYRNSPFLDHRTVTYDDEKYCLPFSYIHDLNEKYEQLPANYIFHNAFSSSTLLTRYFDTLADAFVLREPNILYEIATLIRFENTPNSMQLEGINREDLFRFVRMMLARRYDQCATHHYQTNRWLQPVIA